MSFRVRKLNDAGLRAFADFIAAGAHGKPPLHLLENPETSEPLARDIVAGGADFDSRYEFGIYLKSLLKDFDPAVIGSDRQLWSALGLLWFDRLAPFNAAGGRDVKEEYRFILSSDYRHYYRHLIRSPWQLVREHGPNARLLLNSPREHANPLSVHGEILEQFGGRQQVLGSRHLIDVACRLYLDPVTGRPRTGVAGSGRGSARRFGMVLRQLDLTYDAEIMGIREFLEVLPEEFSRWKLKKTESEQASRVPPEAVASSRG